MQPRRAASAPQTFSISGGENRTFPCSSAAGAWKIDTSGTSAGIMTVPSSITWTSLSFSIDEPAIDDVSAHGWPRAPAASRCTNVRIDQCSNSMPPDIHARWYTPFGPGDMYESPDHEVTIFVARPV